MQNRKLKLIQIFRGFAAILVLLFHITSNFQIIFPGKEFLLGVFAFGADFFFVLSGFIIAYSSLKLIQAGKLLQYIAHRVIRVYPIYWIIFIAFLLPHIFFPQFYSTAYLLNYINILPALLLLPNHTMINGVSWTLSFELYFYLMFLVVFSIKNIKLSGLLILTYVLVVILNNNNAKGLYVFFLSPLILEFFLGILVYFIFQSSLFKSKGLLLVILGGILFLLSGYLANTNYTLFSFNPSLNRVFLFGFPSFLIILGAVIYDTNTNLKVNTFLLTLGDASYSLYLIHLPIVVIMLKILSKQVVLNAYLLNIYSLLIFVFVIFLSLAVNKFIEKPVTKFLKEKV